MGEQAKKDNGSKGGKKTSEKNHKLPVSRQSAPPPDPVTLGNTERGEKKNVGKDSQKGKHNGH